MLSFLGWIPLLGPILQGIGGIVNSFTSKDIAIAKIDGEVAIEAMKANNQITMAFINDIAVRMARDIVMFPGSVWCGLVIWDKIIEIKYPGLVWGVKPLTGVLEYLPFALMGFFFGSSWLNRIK